MSGDLDTVLNSEVDFRINKFTAKSGKQLCDKNSMLRDLCVFMEHPESRSFYEKYLKNPKMFTHIMQLMTIYATLKFKTQSISTDTRRYF